ncbi:two component transcriptional regulator, LytTR family [Lishizhenia tianjinensis]|uniref:Two component transcriptional regulator, LytTR family n=1 Tax=Lishizhenia tianjinensis TaxID=477690 RepID=A0A1I6XCH7_9FLAO|nr:LytTR family DNA-binding domain-containing protein [Lishizhenia tianjinensis]SFT36025.1 two component transcriptional regulator, LytTR family [Lishizhenia tianjinensis]
MRTIIIDDEKQIREGIKILVNTIPNLEVVGEADNIVDGEKLINELKPELVLLDIQLKQDTGFQLLDKIEHKNFHLIFITAYNEYAIKAFKYNAFDYLLKPIDPEELTLTVQRLREQKNIQAEQLIEASKKNEDLKRLVVKTTEQIYVLPLDEIIRCEADLGYTHFYMKSGKRILSSKTLKEYNSLLPEDTFIRIHQSHLVNVNYITSYNKKGVVHLSNNEEVPVSVRKRSLVSELLK